MAIPAPLEKDILKACLDLLALRRIPAWRSNSGRLRVERGGKTHLYAFSGAKGLSDILGLLPPSGRFLAVETKRPGNKPTADQEHFLGMVRDAGGLALVVTGVAELEEALREAGY